MMYTTLKAGENNRFQIFEDTKALDNVDDPAHPHSVYTTY